MRISIDASGLGGPKTGTTVYLAEILAAWNRDFSIKHEFVIFASSKGLRHLSALGLDERFRFVSAPDNRLLRPVWQQSVMDWYIWRLHIDVHWGAGFILPLLGSVPMVVSIHDMTFQIFPSVHERIKRYYFPAMIKAAVKKAKYVLAISESTCNDLHRLLPESDGKTMVTLLAARNLNSGVLTGEEGLKKNDNPYFLFVGTVEPRKNLARLISAWRSIGIDERGQVCLVVVGAAGWLVDELLGQLVHDDAIDFRGSVSDQELALLIRGAMAFVYPSLYEGFGLPVVEAMAQGIPVLTSNVGATREVAVGAAVLVDPESVDAIREGLLSLLHDVKLREELSILGQERAATFSWERAASETLTAIESAVSA